MSSETLRKDIVPQGVLADIMSFGSQMDSKVHDFFSDTEPVLADPLEVLKIKVGNVLLGDYKPLQQIILPNRSEKATQEELRNELDAPKIDQIICEMES